MKELFIAIKRHLWETDRNRLQNSPPKLTASSTSLFLFDNSVSSDGSGGGDGGGGGRCGKEDNSRPLPNPREISRRSAKKRELFYIMI